MAHKRSLEELFPAVMTTPERKKLKTHESTLDEIDSVRKVQLLCNSGKEGHLNAYPPCKVFSITPGQASLVESKMIKYFDDNDVILHLDNATVFIEDGMWWQTLYEDQQAFNLRQYCAKAAAGDIGNGLIGSSSELIMSLSFYWSLDENDKYWLFYDHDCPIKSIKIIVDYDGLEEALKEKVLVMEDVAQEICADHSVLEHETPITCELPSSSFKPYINPDGKNDSTLLVYNGRRLALENSCPGKPVLLFF